MSYDLQPYGGAGPALPRDLRRAGRAISRYRSDGQVAVAGVDTATDLSMAKIDSATAVTGQAMGAVVRVAQAQKALELKNPEASGRLAMLADSHALDMVKLTAEHRRGMRRC